MTTQYLLYLYTELTIPTVLTMITLLTKPTLITNNIYNTQSTVSLH